MLQLVLGPSGTGKSTWLMERIRQRAEQGEKSILLVPEQFTSSTESRIYHALGDGLSGYVASYSFSSLAEKLLKTYGGAAVRTLTDAGRAVLVRRALEAVGDSLTAYRRHRGSTAFCEKCAETLSEFKSAGIRPDQLAELAKQAGSGREKLTELAAIFAAYQALLEGAAMDPSDRLELAADRMDPAFFADVHVFVDEFDTFNAPKRRLLEGILQAAPGVTVALCADGLQDYEGGLGLFSGAKQMAEVLRRMARENAVPVASPVILTEDLRHKDAPALEALACLLRGGSVQEGDLPRNEITLLAADDRAQEAKRAAAAIRQLAQSGVPYGKMAVVCRQSDEYLAPLRYELRLAGIPFFFDEPTTAEQAAPLRLVRALLGLARRGLRTGEILAAAKTGLVELTEPQLCALENYAFTWQLSAAQWRQPFVLSPRGFGADMRPEDAEQLALAEEARSWLIPKLDKFCSEARQQSAAGLCRLIYHTMQALGGEEQVQAAADQMRATDGIPAAEETIRTWNLASGLLDQMALLLGEEKLNPAQYADLFELLARTTDLGHIPQSLDAVIFTTAGRMRLDNPDWCFVLGLGEGQFPRAPGDTGLLTHAERDSLIRQGVEMPDCFENRMVREQVSFYKALTAPARGLWLSWASGPEALPLTGALAPAVALLHPESPRMDDALLAGTPGLALDLLGQTWQADSPETAALYQAVSGTARGEELLEPLRRTAQADPYVVHDRAAMQRLMGKDMRLSPSRMEKYYSCPFSYFMEYVLGARPRRQAALTADQSGNLVHYILEQALQQEHFTDLTEEELAALAARIADQYVAENMPGDQVRFGYLISRLKKSAAGILQFIQSEQKQGLFVPAAFEMGIGTDPDAIPAVVLTTKDGQTVRMIGKIDRVDSYRKNGKTWLRVVDYKTGSKDFLLEDVEQGINCQMLIYLFTLIRTGGQKFPDPAPAGVLYLMADPAPTREDRHKAEQGLEYRVDGMVVNEPGVLDAMDSRGTGLFVPVKFDKAGNAKVGQALSDLEQFDRMQNQLDALVVKMAEQLYDGQIQAEPLHKGKLKKTDCQWCEYRSVCGYEEK